MNDGYELHRALIEWERQKKLDERRIAKQVAAGRKKKKFGRYTTTDLRRELGRRCHERRSPEQLAAEKAKGELTRAMRAQFCDHTKCKPRLMKTGKNAGRWVCPSCRKVVSAPHIEEELVV